MTAARSTRPGTGRSGQVTVQVSKHGAGNVAGPIARHAVAAIAEMVADVKHHRRSGRGE